MATIEIIESSRTLTGREKIKMKDTNNAIKLDEATQQGKVVFAPAEYVVLHVTPEDGDEYNKYVVISKAGDKFVTGSQSFWNAFKSIWDDMSEESEDYEVEVYRVDSKNYKGKQFLSCSIL